ncbi:MAG TPA: hypothetical protein VN325_23300 [Steroidobacteraceae bacterium]|nr:hypothetical protein [Steroidobacteraceae bacterium]
MSVYEGAVKFKPPAEIDPVEEAASYVNHHWFQQLVAVKSECYRCHAQSPIVHLPYAGVLAFGNPQMLRRGHGGAHTKPRDITDEAKKAFAAVGWKFQLRRSYCPKCKDLGST